MGSLIDRPPVSDEQKRIILKEGLELSKYYILLMLRLVDDDVMWGPIKEFEDYLVEEKIIEVFYPDIYKINDKKVKMAKSGPNFKKFLKEIQSI